MRFDVGQQNRVVVETEIYDQTSNPYYSFQMSEMSKMS